MKKKIKKKSKKKGGQAAPNAARGRRARQI
ncbi:hypothetical protein ACVILJ_007456 [Bradyrhizobium diazoefficiens]